MKRHQRCCSLVLTVMDAPGGMARGGGGAANASLLQPGTRSSCTNLRAHLYSGCCRRVYPSRPGWSLSLTLGLFKYLCRFYISVRFVLAKWKKKKRRRHVLELSFWALKLSGLCVLQETEALERCTEVLEGICLCSWVSRPLIGNVRLLWLWWLYFMLLVYQTMLLFRY